MKVAVLDLGLGNLLSLRRGLERAGSLVEVIAQDQASTDVNAFVLPGVGAFRDGITALGKFQTVVEKVKSGEAMMLGICLGMQLLFSKSYEGGEYEGLDILKGDVVRLRPTLKVPHMGWNSISKVGQSLLTEGISENEYFYFVHSYHCLPKEDITVATTDYGGRMTAIVEWKNIFGTQFHPEKSGTAGGILIKNFLGAIKR